jgi:hypothetical protein
VVNGTAFGSGFGFCTVKGLIQTVPTKEALTEWLLEFVSKQKPGRTQRGEVATARHANSGISRAPG